MKKKEIRIRCWVNLDGKKFFGPGPAELLKLIDATGSIAEAARTMDMSYKKAWDIVEGLNSRSKKPYVTSRKGGEKGGGAALTESGRKVLQQYQQLTKKLQAVVKAENTLLKLI
jgi:molybdate transport system regulatory protein